MHNYKYMDLLSLFNEMNSIATEVGEMRKDIQSLTKAVEKLTHTCNRMDKHIDFVENTYESLRHPLSYFKAKVEMITGSTGSTGGDKPLSRMTFTTCEEDAKHT